MAKTLDGILREAKSLSPEERNKLIALLESEMRGEEEHKTVEQLVLERGARPLSFEELLGEPGLAEDQSIEDFLAELSGQETGSAS